MAMELVKTSQLSPLIEEFLATYTLDRPPKHVQPGQQIHKTKYPDFMGGMKVLTFRSGLSERQLLRMLRESSPWTKMATADKLLIALDKHYLLPWMETKNYVPPWLETV